VSPATGLRNAVTARFYPYAESRGFVRAKSKNPLFTVFRRARGDTMQVFDVQWDKSYRPLFVINFTEGPIGGVEFAGAHVPAEDFETFHCWPRGRLKRKPGGSLRCWFRLKKPLIEAIMSMSRWYEPDEVVDQLIACFPEVEAWWADKHEGPHVAILPSPEG
jgi:hypothetical protein